MLGTVQNKLVIVVDEDIDPFNIEHVMWAVATRCRTERDVIIFPHLLGGNLDPAAEEIGTTCGMGIDATRPFGEPFPAVTTILGVERVPDLLAMLERQRAGRG
jgi:3-polyprenyl-4-hydroxybenzoate decarboxylase